MFPPVQYSANAVADFRESAFIDCIEGGVSASPVFDYRHNVFRWKRKIVAGRGRQPGKPVSFTLFDVYVMRGCSSVDRVLASEAKGRWFDSSQPHHFCEDLCPVFRILLYSLVLICKADIACFK
jgi:hypothetical protein